MIFNISDVNVGQMDLRDIDLNLLVLFNDLLITARVNATAERLGLTQPAVSNGLTRLRRALGDELFVRSPDGMIPTPLAQSLAEPVSYALATIHGALNQNVIFDPFISRQNFMLVMTDIGEIHFLPKLMARLAEAAPNVTISTIRNQSIDLARAMEAGDVNLAIGHLPDLKAGFFQRQILSQHYVCLFRQGHPLDKDDLSLADFAGAEHVGIAAAGTGHGSVGEIISRMGITRRVRLNVPHFVSVGHILSNTDMIATVPEVLAYHIARPFGLTWRPHPVALPEISIGLFWHAKYHRDAANQWLRKLVFDVRPASMIEDVR
ncbi:LysR family transcriptional regulator [Xanthobacter sediminis]